jgi:hypothetical protein
VSRAPSRSVADTISESEETDGGEPDQTVRVDPATGEKPKIPSLPPLRPLSKLHFGGSLGLAASDSESSEKEGSSGKEKAATNIPITVVSRPSLESVEEVDDTATGSRGVSPSDDGPPPALTVASASNTGQKSANTSGSATATGSPAMGTSSFPNSPSPQVGLSKTPSFASRPKARRDHSSRQKDDLVIKSLKEVIIDANKRGSVAVKLDKKFVEVICKTLESAVTGERDVTFKLDAMKASSIVVPGVGPY